MKIEMDGNSLIATVIFIAALCLVALCLGGCHIVYQTDIEAIKAGMVQKPTSDNKSFYWSRQ